MIQNRYCIEVADKSDSVGIPHNEYQFHDLGHFRHGVNKVSVFVFYGEVFSRKNYTLIIIWMKHISRCQEIYKL